MPRYLFGWMVYGMTLVLTTIGGIMAWTAYSQSCCGSSPKTVQKDRRTRANIHPSTLILSGSDLYRINCASCHGLDRKGTNLAPSLLSVSSRWTKEKVKEILRNGRGKMPSFGHLSPKERDALLAFLFGERDKRVRVKLNLVRLGEQIVKGNCVSCHRLTRHDPRPPNVWCMEPAPLAGATKRFTKDQVFRLLEQGVCYMPSFRHLTRKEREAVWEFLKTLEGKGEPGRPTMGEVCPGVRRSLGAFSPRRPMCPLMRHRR